MRAQKLPYLDGLLLATALLGAYLAITSGYALRNASAELNRLSRVTGDLVVSDPKRVHIVAIKSEQPSEFAWRVYTPNGYTANVSERQTSSSTTWTSDAQNFIARVRFVTTEDGRYAAYTRFLGGAGLSTLGSANVAQFMEDHWSELIIEQAAAREVKRLARADRCVLLRVSVPDDLLPEARRVFDKHEASSLLPIVFEWQLGPQ